MRLSIDDDLCTGHGRCYAVAPDLFDCDEEGFGQVRQAEVVGDAVDDAHAAVDACPEGAIQLVQIEGRA